MMRVLRIVVLVWIVSGCLSIEAREKKKPLSFEDVPVAVDPRIKFVIFSWAGNDGSYRFALIPDKGDQGHRFLNRFDRQRTPSITLEELQVQLARIPAGSLVTWTKDKGARISYPDRKILQRIKKRCSRLHLDLQFSEPIYDSPDA
jgi:hypothetical protein